jgi:hypothetical protein
MYLCYVDGLFLPLKVTYENKQLPVGSCQQRKQIKRAALARSTLVECGWLMGFLVQDPTGCGHMRPSLDPNRLR